MMLNDSWPEPYLLALPCQSLDLTACPACKGRHGVSGVQLEPFKLVNGSVSGHPLLVQHADCAVLLQA
jgi:hypothetical protein